MRSLPSRANDSQKPGQQISRDGALKARRELSNSLDSPDASARRRRQRPSRVLPRSRPTERERNRNAIDWANLARMNHLHSTICYVHAGSQEPLAKAAAALEQTGVASRDLKFISCSCLRNPSSLKPPSAIPLGYRRQASRARPVLLIAGCLPSASCWWFAVGPGPSGCLVSAAVAAD